MSASSSPVIPAEALLPPTVAGIARAAELLRNGKLVVVPTETVYGIAVNLASAPAREAARALKARAAEAQPASHSPWVVHVASAEEMLSWVPHVSAMGRRLISKAVPGPVAFQVKLDPADEATARKRLGSAADEAIHDGYLQLRCPDFGVTQSVLAEVKSPVAIIGAGTPSQPGIFEAQEVPAVLLSGAERVEGILDGGPTRYRRSSTLVRIEGDGYSVLRAGVIDERILHKLADLTILFICSGNTCRSPMAAAMGAKHLADKLGIAAGELPLRHIVVQSAGLHAGRGMRATLEAVDAVKALGGDLSGHFSQPATVDVLRRADAIYTMTAAHRDEVLELLPAADRKTFLLDPEGDVDDPFGSAYPVYQQVAQRLNILVQKRLAELPL